MVDPCDAGLLAVTVRTARWLHQAQDYHLQGSDGNALVLANQLCAETLYEDLLCLVGDAARMAELAVWHEQACALAAVLERVVLVGDPLRPNEVRLDKSCTSITPQLALFHRENLYPIDHIANGQGVQ